MSEAIQKTKSEASMTFGELLRARKAQIAQVVPKHVTPERMMSVAVNCVAKTPTLQQCTPTSLLQCFLVAAELGLEPGGALGHLYLVPFRDNQSGTTTATPIIGYRGLLELARRTGEVVSMHASVVYERDKFRFAKGIEQTIEHEPFLDGEPGPLKYVYAVAKLKGGEVLIEVMSRAQVEAIRARSRSGKNGPWVTDFDEMAKKTAFRRLAKWLPLSSEIFERALEHDNADFVDGEVAEQAIGAQSESVKERVKGRRMAIVDGDPLPAPTPPPADESTN